MITLPGYQILEQIYDDFRTQVYRGIRQSDGKSVVIKFPKSDYPSYRDLAQFRHQYTIAKTLNISGIIKPYSLETYRNGFALVMEDFGGISLSMYTNNQPLPIAEFLSIALQVVNILEALHHNRIIHQDIKPQNLLINPQTQEVKLTDFSISSLLPRETQEIQTINVLEGTLPYLAPEQTGRMNRGIDYRTDFYSLGITFYELITGKLPCLSTDPMEIIHCHIAKTPIAPIESDRTIPQPISDMIMKLMAKTAEDRYQSAYGIRYDLEVCQQQWQSQNQILPFAIAQRDLSNRFLIPEKLYGREREVKSLLKAFERVAQGHSEILLVAGFSGIGKSAVVQEVHKPIVRYKGYFIQGKFDQLNRNIPWSGWVQVFQELMKQLLAESSNQLQIWKAKLLAALGENAQVIIDVIPELEQIIGSQPAVTELSGSAAQNRFHLLFGQFIRVFATKEHPLVIFLDDLQWADSASLKLIQCLMTDTEIHHLLLMGAYRDHEVNSTHPLSLTLKEIQKTNAHLHTIVLTPLSKEDLNRLVADTLYCSELVAEPLTQLIYAKTKGNPFFSTQLLKSFYEEHLITFNFDERYWECDIAKIRALSLTEDVVEFMALQLKKLPKKTQTVLKLAACIGNSFDLSTLAIVSEKSSIETAQDLWKALQEGLILPQSEIYKFYTLNFEDVATESNLVENADLAFQAPTYKFLHDRVQQAAYVLIDDSQKQLTHLKIGQLLLQSLSPEKREEKIFDIVNQLNKGLDLINAQSQKDELASLNLLAGQKAKLSTAYEPAVRYLTTGLNLLTPESWQSNYDLTLNLYIAASEAEYLNINFIRSMALAETTLANAKNLMDQVKVYELLMSINIAKLEMLKAVEIGLETLERLGIPFLEFTGEESLVLTLPNLEELDQIPRLTNPSVAAALQILKLLCTPVFQAKPEIFPQIILTMVTLCLEHGNSALSAFAYGFYGLLLVGFGKLDLGYKAGKIALKLLEQFKAKELTAKVYNLFNSNIRTWKEPARNSISPLKEGIQIGLETGDLEWGSYCIGNICSYLFFTEENLESAVQQQGSYIDLCLKLKQEIPTSFSQVWQQLGLNFQGKAVNAVILQGESFDEMETLPRLLEAKAGTVLFVFYVAKTILFYHFNEPEYALKHVSLAQEQAGAALGFMQVVILNFYQSLSLLALAEQVDDELRRSYFEQVEKNQEQLKFWMRHAPGCHQHRYELVEAEKARIFEQYWEAGDFYDRAIQNAKENQDLREEALGNELAAKFYLKRGKERIASSYLIEAYYSYARWGSSAKVDDLKKRYPQLLAPIYNRAQNSLTLGNVAASITARTLTSMSWETSDALDLMTVIKASQTITGEVERSRLFVKLMQIILENAGAQSSVLILNREGKLFIEATGIVNSEPLWVQQSIPVETSDRLPLSILNYVYRTHEDVILTHASQQGNFIHDPYMIANPIKSVLCTPILGQGQLIGMLYLENNLIAGTFTPERTQLLKLLCSQAAISLEHIRFYEAQKEYARTLEDKVQELQQTERELRQSEERYRSLVIATSKRVWIWMTDAEGRCYDIPALREYSGLTVEAVSGWGWLEALHPHDREYTAQIWTQAVATKSLYETEYRLRAVDGSYRYFSARGVPILAEDGNIREWVGICADIHDRKQAEIALQKTNEALEFRVQERTAALQQALEQLQQEIVERQQTDIALQESQRALSTLIKNLPGIAYRNRYDEHWTMEFVSEGCFELTGYHPEDLIGNRTLSYEQMTHPEDRNVVRREIEMAIASRQSFNIVYRIITAAGQSKWVWEKGQGIFSTTGEPIALEGFITDISDRKQAEAALQKALAAADAASRAKSEFLSKMSHELRTPLNAVLGFTQILNRDPSVTAQQQEYLGIINRAGEHLLNLINDVLEMSKIEAGCIELNEHTFDLYNLLNSLEEMFRLKAASKGLELIFNLAQDVPQVIKTDERKLRQVLINLIGNAIKFTQQGRVILRVSRRQDNVNRQPRLVRRLATNRQLSTNCQLFFEIEDTGSGIAPEEVDTLFEAFVQTASGRKSQSGTGLGLPISRQFVQLMGGEIIVSSTLSQGSLFKFNIQTSLPEVAEIPSSTVTQKVIALEPNQPNYRILVVEDQPESRLLLVNLLSQVGFEVCHAVNGQEAVTLTESWQPHLIWMDIQMPIMNGYEATQRIRSLGLLPTRSVQRQPLIIIALTANAFAEDKAAILAAGCDDFVSKPFREAVIFEKIAQYLEVRYVYEKSTIIGSEKSKSETPYFSLNSESFQEIPLEWREQLYQAAIALDDERIGQFIAEICESHPAFAKTLADLLKQLRFDKIIEILEKLKLER